MSDDKTQTGGQDRLRISLSDDYEVRDWCKKYGVSEERLRAAVGKYPAGAGIGWHRDRPEYGKIVGVSFESPCALRLRRREGAGWRRGSVPLEPRSAYLLDGEVREAWQHSITPGDQLRYSVTFRTLR